LHQHAVIAPEAFNHYRGKAAFSHLLGKRPKKGIHFSVSHFMVLL